MFYKLFKIHQQIFLAIFNREIIICNNLKKISSVGCNLQIFVHFIAPLLKGKTKRWTCHERKFFHQKNEHAVDKTIFHSWEFFGTICMLSFFSTHTMHACAQEALKILIIIFSLVHRVAIIITMSASD